MERIDATCCGTTTYESVYIQPKNEKSENQASDLLSKLLTFQVGTFLMTEIKKAYRMIIDRTPHDNHPHIYNTRIHERRTTT